MKIEALDHVALWVSDRDELAAFLTEHVGMHVIDRTDAFTIVGADARRGKLTLFAAEGERHPGPLERIVVRVADLERAISRLPRDVPISRPRPRLASFSGPQRLGLGLIEATEARVEVEYDLDHVIHRFEDPDRARAELLTLGFQPDGDRVRAGDAYIELEGGGGGEPERPLLNHLGLRVQSAEQHLEEARRRELEIADVVDAANTYAVFVWGPERLKLEYVEHKASFSLV
jgi:catechol 2,3-dioxygenase-like lactoylglutathione lyase family enzyme